jgi:hypothetical protein
MGIQSYSQQFLPASNAGHFMPFFIMHSGFNVAHALAMGSSFVLFQ